MQLTEDELIRMTDHHSNDDRDCSISAPTSSSVSSTGIRSGKELLKSNRCDDGAGNMALFCGILACWSTERRNQVVRFWNLG